MTMIQEHVCKVTFMLSLPATESGFWL